MWYVGHLLDIPDAEEPLWQFDHNLSNSNWVPGWDLLLKYEFEVASQVNVTQDSGNSPFPFLIPSLLDPWSVG